MSDFGVSIAFCKLVMLMMQDAAVEGRDLLKLLTRPFEDAEVAYRVCMAGSLDKAEPGLVADYVFKRGGLAGTEIWDDRLVKILTGMKGS